MIGIIKGIHDFWKNDFYNLSVRIFSANIQNIHTDTLLYIDPIPFPYWVNSQELIIQLDGRICTGRGASVIFDLQDQRSEWCSLYVL